MINLFSNLPSCLPEELVDLIVAAPNVRVERIVSTGQSSPEGFWYDQHDHEWVAVLQGQARLEFDDGEVLSMGPGDSVLIPAHRRHRVAWTTPDGPTVWLAVHFGGRIDKS